MTMATEQVPAGPFTLKMKRTVKAKRDRVFDAFVDATHSKFAKEEFRDNHNKGWQSVLDGLEQQIQSL